MQKYVCDICGYIYDPEVGDPDSGVAPEQRSKIFRTIGCVPCAALEKKIFRQKTRKQP